MPYDLMNILNLDPSEDLEESLRLAFMFKAEVDNAAHAYMEILRITIDGSSRSSEEVSRAMREAITASLLTGIRAYRSWIQSQGVDVQGVEENSGKDIPVDFFRDNARWPL